MGIETISIIIALVLSIILHEVAHGYAANWLGDPTARLAGRLTLNPISHIDPLGSIVVPGLLFFSGVPFLFGWAKPVPYNPYNLKNQRWGEAIVAFAGPGTNLLLALIFGIFIHFGATTGILSLATLQLASYIVFINVLLALFNLIPFPPLDGSKVLDALLPYRARIAYQKLAHFTARHSLAVTLIFIFIIVNFLWKYIAAGVFVIATLFTGLAPHEFLQLLNV